MSGTAPQPAGGTPPPDGTSLPHPASRPAGPPTRSKPALPGTGNPGSGTAGPPQRHRSGAVATPVAGKPHKPCSRPPKPRDAAYDRRPAAGPGRTSRRTQRRSTQTRQVQVELPEEPPQLTPEAAWALLRVLLKARAARHDAQEGARPMAQQPAPLIPDQEEG